ncbi:hypothetical protein TKWG_16705 [Advenella kashmirensis WT001]|uniref:Uncharacterized protein n=1 Tax=Advenella kashmirensis (strain DSM 17095 / LMG 22695 / WT001) TaxID=1036672 RepID=I3UE39_ADVKW|nr:hypothetical protein TKWG_16705 [Advenella kashmirensis WT001]
MVGKRGNWAASRNSGPTQIRTPAASPVRPGKSGPLITLVRYGWPTSPKLGITPTFGVFFMVIA